VIGAENSEWIMHNDETVQIWNLTSEGVVCDRVRDAIYEITESDDE
jgi:hypothetical protein